MRKRLTVRQRDREGSETERQTSREIETERDIHREGQRDSDIPD